MTLTGSVADTIAPNMNAATGSNWPLAESPNAMKPVVNRTPGTAKIAIDQARRCNAPASSFQAASKISGGRKINSSAGPKENGKSIGALLDTIAPKPTSATAGGKRMRSATIATSTAAASNSTNAVVPSSRLLTTMMV
jgi:hypothetical protein